MMNSGLIVTLTAGSSEPGLASRILASLNLVSMNMGASDCVASPKVSCMSASSSCSAWQSQISHFLFRFELAELEVVFHHPAHKSHSLATSLQ